MSFPPLFPRLPHTACTVTIKVTHTEQGWDSHLVVDKLGRKGEINCPNRKSSRSAIFDALHCLEQTGEI